MISRWWRADPGDVRSQLPSRLIEVSVRNPRVAVGVWAAILLAVSPGLWMLTVDTSTDSVLDQSGESWAFYEQSQDMFGGDEIVVVALSSTVPFSAESLKVHDRLAKRFEEIDGVARVDSLSTFPVVEVTPEGQLVLDPALVLPSDTPLEAYARVERIAAFDRILPRTLVSDDGKTTAISLVLESGVEDQQQRILQEIESHLAGVEARVSGVPVFRVEANRRTGSEITKFAQATALILSIYLFTMFRSMRAVLYGVSTGVFGTIIVTSILGWMDIPLSISTMILPSMLIALGCAYSMHLLVACSDEDTAEGIIKSATGLALPLSLSGLTTAVGLVSLTLVGIDAVVHVGTCGAAGVLIITTMTLSLLPALFRLAPIRRRPVGRDWKFDRLVGFLDARRTALVVFWAATTTLFCAGLAMVEVETDATTWFRDGHPVRQAYVEIRERLSGISPMNVVIEAPAGESVLEPEILAKIDLLSDLLEQRQDVGKAISVADPLRQIHGGFLNDPKLPLPADRASAEQYMLLLESVEHIQEVLSDDRKAANILLRVDDNGSGDILALAEFAEGWWEENGPPGTAARATGIMFEFARAEDTIAYGQISGLSFALVSISLIILLMLRRLRLAIVALIPNALPLAIIFGFMGLAGIPLDAGTVLIGALALGVAVDDTIHLMTAIVAGINRGLSAQAALAGAFQTVLPAIVSSTAMISVGFGVFVISDFALTRNLGWLTSCVMVVCLLADVFLLGALVVRADWSRYRAYSAAL